MSNAIRYFNFSFLLVNTLEWFYLTRETGSRIFQWNWSLEWRWLLVIHKIWSVKQFSDLVLLCTRLSCSTSQLFQHNQVSHFKWNGLGLYFTTMSSSYLSLMMSLSNKFRSSVTFQRSGSFKCRQVAIDHFSNWMHEISETVYKLLNLERDTLYWQDERERLHETLLSPTSPFWATSPLIGRTSSDSMARNVKGSQKITLQFLCTNKIYKTIYIFTVAVIGCNLLDRLFWHYPVRRTRNP